MSQYIILIDVRDNGPGVTPSICVIKDAQNEITIFDDIADATDVCKKHELCKCFPCEIVDIDELGWCY